MADVGGLAMTGQVMIGRMVAAVGLVLGVVAIWTAFLPEQKYWDDGTVAGFLLILAALTALLLLAAMASGRRDLDIAMGAVGGAMFGFYLFVPVLTAFDQWDELEAGAWLGVCSGLIVVGAVVAAWRPGAAFVRPAALGAFLAVVGLALVFGGIFPDVQEDQGSYWNVEGLGHSAGIFLIILTVLGLAAVAAAHVNRLASDAALILAGITLGFTLALPVGNAFDNLGRLEAGAWLAGVGGVILMVGVLAMRWLAPSTHPSAAPPPPAAPPPASTAPS